MTQAARVISHRDGVPIYQYRTDPDTSPVSVHRHTGRPRRTGSSHPRFPGAVVRPRGGPGVRGGPGRGARPGAAETGCRGRGVLRSSRARRGRPIAVAGVAGTPAALPVPARALGWGAAAGGARGPAIHVGQRDRVDRNRTDRPAGGLSTGGPGAPDAATDRARALGPRRGGRPAAQRGTAAGRRVRGDRPAARRAVVAARRGARSRHDAGAPDHRRAPPHRTHRAGVDHRTPHGRSPHVAGRHGSSGRGGSQAGRGLRSRLFQQALQPGRTAPRPAVAWPPVRRTSANSDRQAPGIR